MRFWVGVGSAFGAGTLIGIGIGILSVEKKLKAEYEEATAAHWRVVQAVKIDQETEAMVSNMADDMLVRRDPEAVKLEGGDIEVEKVAATVSPLIPEQVTGKENPYHQAVQSTMSDYASFAELSEEDYQEDDGRVKEQLTMLFSDGEPIFFQNGAEISVSDVMDLVGGTIVDDMRAAVQSGNPYVWIRNNQTDVDYEVVFEQP